MYGLVKILDIISPTAIRLRHPKTWKIHTVLFISVIELYVKENRDLNLNTVLNTSDPIENAAEYDIDKVMGSTE
jgi:hypothetical protein